MSNLIKTDSPNCDTETANRTIQTGSLTVPADRQSWMYFRSSRVRGGGR